MSSRKLDVSKTFGRNLVSDRDRKVSPDSQQKKSTKVKFVLCIERSICALPGLHPPSAFLFPICNGLRRLILLFPVTDVDFGSVRLEVSFRENSR